MTAHFIFSTSTHLIVNFRNQIVTEIILIGFPYRHVGTTLLGTVFKTANWSVFYSFRHKLAMDANCKFDVDDDMAASFLYTDFIISF